MNIIQILLPLEKNDGQPQDREAFQSVRTMLTDRFGGITAYTHSPAEGVWKAEDGLDRDRVVIFEIMVETLDRDWWTDYRKELERMFEQEMIIIRAHPIELL